MPPRSIPRVIPVNTRAKQNQEEIKRKPSSDDSDGYGDDFEEEEAEKEILAKPNLNFTLKKNPTKEEEPPRKKVVAEPVRKETSSEEEYEDDFASPDFASPQYPQYGSAQIKNNQYREPERPSPAEEEYENVVVTKESLKSFTEDKRPETIYVDPEMRETQKERIKYLKDYVNLEYEAFDNLLEILPSSEYGLYVSRIQNGILANSGDQTNDERVTRDIQTEDEFQNDFGVQWPEDKNRNVFSSVTTRDVNMREEVDRGNFELEDTNKLIEFVKNAYPVVDEILTYQTKNIISKDKMVNIVAVEETLSFPEELSDIFEGIKLLTAFEATITQLFVSYRVTFTFNGKAFPLGLVVEYLNLSPSRYFISLSEVLCLYISINFKHALIGGTKDGSMLLWDLRDSNLFHSKNIHEIVTKIKEKEAGRFGDKFIYRFPNYSTDYLAENGHTSSVIKIKDTYSSKNVYEIFSLDDFGRVINWNIGILSKFDQGQFLGDPGMNFDSKIKLVKIAQFDISEYYQIGVRNNEALLCSDMDIDKQGTNLFITNQKGLAKIETIGQTKPPKTYENSDQENGPIAIAVSAAEYLYIGNRDGTMEILSKNYSKPVALIGPFAKKPIINILIPKYYPITLRNPSKYLEQLTKPIVFDTDGNVYFFSLDQSFQPSHVENPIKSRAGNQPFKLLRVWFESNLDMHMLYLINKTELMHLNLNCSKLLDTTHEPIMQKQKKLSLLFKVT